MIPTCVMMTVNLISAVRNSVDGLMLSMENVI